ncbi:MAG: DUF559 domain-containing protein [Microbacterium enclense]
MLRRPLPAELGAAFTVQEARRLDVRRDRLLARDLSAPFHGVRSRSADMRSVRERCDAYAPRLRPAQFFSHETAAALWELPLPTAHPAGLHVSAIAPAREPRTVGVIGHRLRMSTACLTLRRGLPVTTAAETWAQLAATMSEDDLVAIGDHILTHGLADRDDLGDACTRLRRRGAIDLAPALASVRPGAESPRESKVRRILVRAGLPEPELNWTLRDTRGVFIARLDMAYEHHRVAVEYDGRQHADVHQFRRDADRWPAITAQGWLLVRIVDHHLRDPDRFIVAPTVAALRSRGWRP